MIQRQAKEAGVVIINKIDYDKKLPDLFINPSKFATCDFKHAETMKNKINIMTDNYNSTYKTEATALSDICYPFENSQYYLSDMKETENQ